MNSLTNTGIIVLTVILSILPFHIWAQEIEVSVYEDPEGRFTIEYPSDWHVNEEPQKSTEEIVVQFDSSEPDMIGDIDATMPNVQIMVRDPLPVETSLETLSNNLASNMAEAGEIGESTYTTLSGLRAYTMADVLFDIHAKGVWTIHNDKVYSIHYNAHPYDYEIYLPTFQQMIDSFHITQASNVTDNEISQAPNCNINPDAEGCDQVGSPTNGEGNEDEDDQSTDEDDNNNSNENEEN